MAEEAIEDKEGHVRHHGGHGAVARPHRRQILLLNINYILTLVRRLFQLILPKNCRHPKEGFKNKTLGEIRREDSGRTHLKGKLTETKTWEKLGQYTADD